MPKQRILVTGGAGFIGSSVCRQLVESGRYHVVNVDKLTYCGNPNSLREIEKSPDYKFFQADICDQTAMLSILRDEGIDKVLHLAAESHVDRSIDSPAEFVNTNIIGTFRLLDAALKFWRELNGEARDDFRFHHVSTDEVFGDLPFDNGVFTEQTPYAPSSPYAASKASSDHLVRAWHETYGLPVVISNCSNNYGPYHFPEKLVPRTVLNCLDGYPLLVYGEGDNVRDWLFVEDHARALELVLTQGEIGESYNVGARAERSNLEVIHAICDLLDLKRPAANGKSRRELIQFVEDRPGHDRRYAIDPSKIERELGWCAIESFESGLNKTVDWYLANEWWWRPIRDPKKACSRLGTVG